MKKKIVTIMLLTLAASILVSIAYADYIPRGIQLQARPTDYQYMPGQSGTLYVVVLNYRTTPVEIKNITIFYPWFAYVKDTGWTGNDTIVPSTSEKTLASSGGKFEKEISFNVPSDGRLLTMTSTASVVVYDNNDNVIATADVPININVPAIHSTIQDVDKITTLFTVLVVLVIVCTIIIAATIFLSMRRPQPVWKAEQK
jgi:hypothetical protein